MNQQARVEMRSEGTPTPGLDTISAALHRVRTGFHNDAFQAALWNTEVVSEDFLREEGKRESIKKPIRTPRRGFLATNAVERTFNISMMTPRQGPCHPRFHSLDGSCADEQGMGKVLDSYARLLPHNYCDEQHSLRCAKDGSPLPNPRTISLMMQGSGLRVPFNNERSRLLADFGQFITHDMMQTPDMAGDGPDPCNCKRDDVCVNVFPPDNEPVIKLFQCLFIVKSTGKLIQTGSDMKVKKEQINQLTSFLDNTNVYGTNMQLMNALRDELDKTKLKMVSEKTARSRLPTLKHIKFLTPEKREKFELPKFLNEEDGPGQG